MAGGDFDNWDLKVRGGLLGSAQLRMAVEEHGAGKQLLRFSLNSFYSRWGLILATLFGSSGVIAGLDSHWAVAVILLGISLAILVRSYYEALTSIKAFNEALNLIAREVKKVRDAGENSANS